MAVKDCSNQHFVPQFYFRHFSSEGKTIGTLLKRDGRAIPRASIKGQCAKKSFYGSNELESLFSMLETRHCDAIRATLKIAYDPSSGCLSDVGLLSLLQAITFQRGRTELEIHKSAKAMEKLTLEAFKHYLQNRKDLENPEELIRHIDAGNVTVTENPQAAVCSEVSIMLESTGGITDLHLCLLRNLTDYPFIFSDAPVVFINSYCRKVRNRGVLGLQCPGLQIFFPLDSWTLALLLDSEKYTGLCREHHIVDIYERSEVSQINALQLHHSLNAVYFGYPEHQEYVQKLWRAHRSSLRVPRTECIVGPNLWVDGKPPEGELIQIMEQQIDFDLNLSFMQCQQIAEADYVFRPRRAELRNELRRRNRGARESAR